MYSEYIQDRMEHARKERARCQATQDHNGQMLWAGYLRCLTDLAAKPEPTPAPDPTPEPESTPAPTPKPTPKKRGRKARVK